MWIRRIIVLTAFLSMMGMAQAKPVVIVNRNNNISGMSRNEIIDLFMGRTKAFPNGSPVIPCDQGYNSETAAQFYRLLTGKSLAQINAYWARLIFTGRAVPPLQLKGNTMVLVEVRKNPAAIGYIDEKYVNDSVRVIFRFD